MDLSLTLSTDQDGAIPELSLFKLRKRILNTIDIHLKLLDYGLDAVQRREPQHLDMYPPRGRQAPLNADAAAQDLRGWQNEILL